MPRDFLFDDLLSERPEQPAPNCITSGLILLGTLLLVAFFVVGVLTTIGWLL